MAMVLAIVCALGWTPAQALSLPGSPKPIDLTFLQNLQAGKVDFNQTPLSSPPDPNRASADLPDMVRLRNMQAAGEELIDELLAHHPGPKPAHIAFIVTTTPDFNCVTLLTGQIACTAVVMQELLDSPMGRQELAFMLAHELGHRLIAGHGERFAKSDKMKAEMFQMGEFAAFALDAALSKRTTTGNTVTITPTPAATSAFWNSYFGGVYAGDAAGGLASLAWSQKEEDEADQYGMFLMQRAGFDPGAAPQLFKRLQAQVKTNELHHDSALKSVADKAAGAAFMQGIVNGKSWISIASSGVLGGLSAMDEIGADHYHRNFDDRAVRCEAIAKVLVPEETDAEKDAAYAAEVAKLDGGGAQTEVAAATPATHGHGHTAAHKGRSGGAPQVTLTAWDRAVAEKSALGEIALAHQVLETLGTKGDAEALKLCPSHPVEPGLAVACGIAMAGDGQQDQANGLFAKALADDYASPQMFRSVALTRAQMKNVPGALKTLDAADVRFPGGQFYPDRITLLLAAGDEVGARAAAERCQTEASQQTKGVCTRLMLQSKPSPT